MAVVDVDARLAYGSQLASMTAQRAAPRAAARKPRAESEASAGTTCNAMYVVADVGLTPANKHMCGEKNSSSGSLQAWRAVRAPQYRQADQTVPSRPASAFGLSDRRSLLALPRHTPVKSQHPLLPSGGRHPPDRPRTAPQLRGLAAARSAKTLHLRSNPSLGPIVGPPDPLRPWRHPPRLVSSPSRRTASQRAAIKEALLEWREGERQRGKERLERAHHFLAWTS